MSSDVSGTESGSESGPESVPEPVPEPGPEPESEPGPGPAPGPGPGPAPGPGPGLGREPGQRYQPCQLCPEHGKPLSWFCLSERRPVCATCAGFGGRCHRHRIRRAEEHAEELRNKIVDHCEKLQLQSAGITKYVAEVLQGKNQKAMIMANATREVIIQRLSLVRCLCESEEQRLLEQVHSEEERAHQCILTQRAHWDDKLRKLDSLRTSMVDMLTHLNDLQLIQMEQEILERAEEAEGILEPQESEKLSFNEKCAWSPLLTQLWATSVLGSLSAMRVVDESQWDEAVCTLAGCQHPQCWASLRRIERGHPRILDTSSKSPWESEDKLPTLTVVNIMDTCLWAKKRVVQRQASEFTFPKERSLLLKPASKCHGRSWKSLRDKDATSHSRPPKLSVLNLNEAKLPFSGDDRNMVVTWVPEEMAKKTIQEKAGVPSRSVKKRRKKWGETSKPSLYYRGRRYLRSPAVLVPPPSPVHFLEQLHSEAIPLWAQVDMLPQDLLKECILSHEKSTACPEVKMELSKMKKSLPLEKSRPDSAVSSKMYLTIQRLTLQRPSLRYPDCLKKLRHNLKGGEGPAGHGSSDSWKQQEEKTSTKKQEAKKKAKRDVEEQYGEETMSSDSFHDHSFHDPSFHDHVGLRISRREIERKLLKGEVGMEKTSLERRVSVEEPMAYEFGSYYTASYYTSPESALLYETIYQDLNDGEETELEVEAFSKDNNPKSLSAVMDNISWNPELKLLRILQATEEENEEGHLSRAQSEASLEA